MIQTRRAFGGLLALGLVLAAGSAFGQITGTILGAISDDQGLVLPGATVSVSSEQLPGGPRMAVTNASGQYRFPNLPPGDYTLTVELPGFGTYIEEGMQVLVGGTIERAVSLSLATVAETVTVTGETPVVDTRKSGVSTNYSSEYMENTPLRRFSFFDFTKSAPGMSATNPTSGTSSRVSAFGSGVDENKYLMDGVDFTAPVSGAAWPWPATDLIEEMEIVSLGASAEHGSAAGAVFNVVTKQGTNDFTFTGAGYKQTQSLTTQPIKLNADGDEDPNGWGYNRDRYDDYTIHGGGPIIRDRAWLYANYQYLQDWDTQPGADPQFPRKFGAHRMFWKLTADLTPNVKFMHTYHDDIWVIPSTPSVSRPFSTIATFSGKNPSVTFGRITHILSAETFYEVGVSGFYSPRDLSESNNPGVPGIADIDNGIRYGGYPWYDIFKQARTDVKAKVSHYASDWLGADHDFKFGVNYVDGSHSIHGGYVPGPNYPGGVYYYINGDGTPYGILTGTTYNIGGQFKETAAYVEDVINVGNRVTVSAGVRMDRVRGLSQDVDDLLVNDLVALTFDERGTVTGAGEQFSWTNFGPRLGFNVRLDEDARTVLRGNWGRFYRTAITGELHALHPGQGSQQEFYWNEETERYDIEGPKYEPSTDSSYDPNSRSPVTDQMSIGFDRELGTSLAFNFTYVRKDQNDLLGWNVNNSTYTTASHTFGNGQTIEVYPITSDRDQRLYSLGNVDCEGVSYRCDPMYMDYNGFVFGLDKRMSDNWQAQISYVWSKAYGLLPSSGFGASSSQTTRVYGSSLAKDPNQFINAEGHLLNDRTHTFRITGTVILPFDVLFGWNYAYFNGKPWAERGRVERDVLPQGGRSVNLESPGSRRLDDQSILDFRVSKSAFLADRTRFEVFIDALNLMNATSPEDVASQTWDSSLFAVGERFVDPRRLMIGLKITY